MAKLFNDGFGVLETNHVAAVRTGQIQAQYLMTPELLAAGAENGMLLALDHVNKQVGFAADAETETYLHASEEMIYEEHLGRNSFVLNKNIPPKMLKLNKGDIFETNAVDGGTFTLATAKAAVETGLFGIAGDAGYIVLSNALGTADAATVLQVTGFVTLPSGNEGIQFVVNQA